MHYRVCLVTVPPAVAESLAETIVREKLAACVNIVSAVKSIYWWQDEIQCDEEALLVIKTVEDMVPKLIQRIDTVHPYEVPEVIALPIVQGHENYLAWIDGSLTETSGLKTTTTGK